jgi:ABC-type multidrug transport system fused ATPase/permease subunit
MAFHLSFYLPSQEIPDAKPLEISKGEIEFRNVSFGYDKEKSILQNMNIKIPGGSKVAFVGTSGSG